MRIINRRYDVDLIKTFTLLAIICGFLFSGISYIHRMSFLPPNQEIVESLQWLNKHSNYGDVVLSHYSCGFWISYFAQRTAFSDDNDMKNSLSYSIYYGRNLKNLTDVFDQNNIKYVWITDDMKKGMVWSRPDEGLLFLLHNSEKFNKIYSSDNTEIWEYNR